ncbi:hypothetical protein E2C01_007256 [Portunus trituberculatus]|uniref:Uncharacterized protein n=1 Tax=Portunus trituberculatus TaxID=210409 RepID=A0A5B7CYQ0_PORTR|nr:hypothetical protein [Portunus trituberculatus]
MPLRDWPPESRGGLLTKNSSYQYVYLPMLQNYLMASLGDIAESLVLQGTACTQMAVGWAPCWGGSNKPESGRNALEVNTQV